MRERRVLIIDDEPAIGRALRPALQGHQFAVSVAVTGAEGLGRLAREEPDLVLLDLGLPDADGLVVLRQIRAQSAAP